MLSTGTGFWYYGLHGMAWHAVCRYRLQGGGGTGAGRYDHEGMPTINNHGPWHDYSYHVVVVVVDVRWKTVYCWA